MCSAMPSWDWTLLRCLSILPHFSRSNACWPLPKRLLEKQGLAHRSCSKGCACQTPEREDPMSVVMLLARLLLAAVFLVAGLAKLADRAGSRQALRDFGVPARLANAFGVLLPLAELAVAVALLFPATAWWGAVGALALLLLFVGGIGYNLAHGRQPDCHCFGQLHSAPAGWPTLIRNLVLAAVAAVVVVVGWSSSQLSVVDWLAPLSVSQRIEVLVGLLVLVLLLAGGWLLVQVLSQQGRLLLRIEALEAELAASGMAPQSVA